MKLHIFTYWGASDIGKTCKIHIAVSVCHYLQICNSVANMVVMGLVLGQSLMVISALLLCKSVSPLLCTVRFAVVYM